MTRQMLVLTSLMAVLASTMDLTGCSRSGGPSPMTALPTSSSQPRVSSNVAWSQVYSFAYQLQNIHLQTLAKSRFQMIVMDFSKDGSDQERFTRQQIESLQRGQGGRKLVLAYMSIGEAESYRWYWKDAWDEDGDGTPDKNAPSWLGPENPNWPGNYEVKYWDPRWQSLLYGSPTSYLDKIIAAGYDGVYLDVVDAYEFWEPGGSGRQNRATAEQDMVTLVQRIAQYARVTKGVKDFGVFVQNGSALAADPVYVKTVTGIGAEDTWTVGDEPQLATDTRDVLHNLDIFKRAGKLVLVIDYPTKPTLIRQFYANAREKGYIPYATDRDLNTLTVNPEDVPQ